MADIIYTLSITRLSTVTQEDGEPDVVVRAEWAYTGALNGQTSSFAGVNLFTLDPKAPFTPFKELTEKQVAEWVLNGWLPEQRAGYEQMIAYRLSIASPWGPPDTVADTLPWDASVQPAAAV